METNNSNNISHETTIFAEPVAHFGPPVGGFTITNALLTSWAVVGIILIISLILRLRLRQVPGKLQNLFELIVDGAISLCDQVTGNRRISEKIFPIAISAFFFILLNNWLGIIPLGAVTRLYVDEAGRLNQRIAALADNVTFVAAGLPLRLKSTPTASRYELSPLA